MKTYTATKKANSNQTYTQEEKDAFKQAKLEATASKINEGILAATTSEGWVKFLHFARSFHNYSVRNWILIWTQCPTATRVAGFNAWKERERFVKKGEKGLLIYRPIVKKVQGEGGEWESRVVGFATTYVWDVQQTEGAALPEYPIKYLAEGVHSNALLEDRAGYAISKLADRITDNGGEFAYATAETDKGFANGAHGYVQRATKDQPFKVCIEERGTLDMLKTCVHEVAHTLLHADLQHLVKFAPQKTAEGEDAPKPVITKMQAELEAESTAFLVCERLGLDTGCYSFPYMASWAASASTQEGGLSAVTLQMVARIQKAVKVILEWLGINDNDEMDDE